MEQSNKDKGLGDSIARVTHATGIDQLVERTAKLMGSQDCGCKKRQEELNKLFPYKKR